MTTYANPTRAIALEHPPDHVVPRRFFAFLLALLVLFPTTPLPAQELGYVYGSVVDATTQAPLSAARVYVEGTDNGILTRGDGTFELRGLPAGSYVVTVAQIGYASVAVADVIVSPGRGTHMDAALRAQAVELKGIVVDAGRFRGAAEEPVSSVVLNREEIRRAPGTVGDVSRVLTALPSMAQVSDNANDLFVRGGSPFENGFFVDEIQVPNINHFPIAGATGGAIGLLNVDLIDDVRFTAGGFGAAYGNRLSSIASIELREGSREKLETRAEASLMGFGGTLEGPLAGGDGSWLITGRNSTLDLLADAFGSSGIAPSYADFTAKATRELNDRDRIGLIALGGRSRVSFTPTQAREEGYTDFGDQNADQITIGGTWRRLWGERGYSVFSASFSGQWEERDIVSVVRGDTLLAADNVERSVRLRSIHRLVTGDDSFLSLGAELEVEDHSFDYSAGEVEDRLGNTLPGEEISRRWRDSRIGGSVSHVWQVTPRLETTAGVRLDRWGSQRRTSVSPRLGLVYTPDDRLSLNGAVGLYHQRLPALILSQDEQFEGLQEPRALHVIAGASYLLNPSTRLSFELYQKTYTRFPLEIEDPSLFVVDDGTSQGGFRTYRTLVDDGRADARGVEVFVQKKLTSRVYGSASGAWSRSRYRDLEGRWRNRAWDNRWVATLLGGYRFSHAWEVSARWSAAGGAPYTPFDIGASTALNRGVIDATQLHAERNPAYHTLNLRIDHRRVLRGSTMTLFLSIWNAYDRENIAQRYWNEFDIRPDALHQWGLFPVIGLEWHF